MEEEGAGWLVPEDSVRDGVEDCSYKICEEGVCIVLGLE